MDTNEPAISAFTENAASEFYAWIVANTDATEESVSKSHRDALGRLLGTWLATKLLGLLEEKKESVNDTNLTAENFAEFLAMIFQKKLSNTNGFSVLEHMLENGRDPHEVVAELGVGADTSVDINDIADKVIASLPTQVADYRSGKTALLQFFVGQVMKETKSAADPSEVSKLLIDKLR